MTSTPPQTFICAARSRRLHSPACRAYALPADLARVAIEYRLAVDSDVLEVPRADQFYARSFRTWVRDSADSVVGLVGARLAQRRSCRICLPRFSTNPVHHWPYFRLGDWRRQGFAAVGAVIVTRDMEVLGVLSGVEEVVTGPCVRYELGFPGGHTFVIRGPEAGQYIVGGGHSPGEVQGWIEAERQMREHYYETGELR